MPEEYTQSLTNYNRFKTGIVGVGKVPVGGDTPIKVQSMTNTDTKDIQTTVEQILEIFEKGADLVRITVPTMLDLEAAKIIKCKLHNKGIGDKPLIADIHFNYKIAFEAIPIFEKIRINPGNLVDKKLRNRQITDEEYQKDLKKIEQVLLPLLKFARESHTAVRVGTNHGSLSDRILQKYGDSPVGMVQATLEYLEIARKLAFKDIIISLKASDPKIMIYANRLMIKKMKEKGMNFPIHLGVTEAGNGLQARIKSAVGIGGLLLDGIGDTIRVSLTEPPSDEIPVCFEIINYALKRKNSIKFPEIPFFFDPYNYSRRASFEVLGIGNDNPPVVIVDLIGKNYNIFDYKRVPDFVIIDENYDEFIKKGIKVITTKTKNADGKNIFPLVEAKNYKGSNEFVFVNITYSDLTPQTVENLRKSRNTILILNLKTDNIIGEIRFFFYKLQKAGLKNPVILKIENFSTDIEHMAIETAIDSSLAFTDGLADGLFIENKQASVEEIIKTAFGILQATRRRITETEYISCPGCGRTLFDLQEVTEKIKKATSHLSGLKIAIMGCIVNGIGEMADADFGYVGSVKGLVSLYRGKKAVKTKIPEDEAVRELINLIKESGKWTEP